MAQIPTALLLPGLNGSCLFYKALIAELKGVVDCTTADLPQEGDQDYPTLVEDLRTRFANTDFSVVIAESFSGPLAVHAIAKGALSSQALVLGATFLTTPYRSIPRDWFSGLAAMGGQHSFLTLPYIRTFLLNGGCAVNANEVLAETNRLPPEMIRARTTIATGADAREAYKGLTLPILVLNAKRDRLIFSFDRSTFSANDNAEVIWLDAPHFLFQCAAQDAARAIQLFLNDKGLLAA